LFFTCSLANQDDYGTLVISVPGSSYSRAAVSPAFVSTLSYLINCSGPGSVIRTVKAGAPAAISLLGGYWNVSVTVLNAAGEGIGSEEATVYIEGGKTVSLYLPITIEINHNKIKYFALTNPIFVIGDIIDNFTGGDYTGTGSGKIDISVPFGTEITDVGYSMVHTGIKVENSAFPEHSKSRGHFNVPQTFVVSAENEENREYIVEAELELPEIRNNVWPKSTSEDKIWDGFGFYEDLANPGNSVVHAEVENTETGYRSMAILFVSTLPLNLHAFSQNIESLVPEVLEATEESTYVRIKYQANYGMEYELALSQYGFSDLYYMTIINNTIIPKTSWPINSVWQYYGLSGLDPPENTIVISVKDDRRSPVKARLAVVLIGAEYASYQNLRNQLIKMLGAPAALYPMMITEMDLDKFIAPGPPEITVRISMVKDMIGIQIDRDNLISDDEP